MRKPVILSLFILALLCAPTVAQMDESESYFNLSTEKTFGSGETPKVRLWARGIHKLQFRVYRVRDTLAFFRQLEDAHHFGGESHRPPGELTVLERYHRWKHSSRSWMRNVVRRQFTQDGRTAFHEAVAQRQAIPRQTGGDSQATQYADVPILNRQQLVSVWEHTYQAAHPWESQSLAVDLKERGVYLVEATDGKLQAYTIICVSDLILITRSGQGSILARVVDRKKGTGISGAEVYGWAGRKEFVRAVSDAAGFASIPKPPAATEGASENLMLVANRGSDFAPVAISEWEMRNIDAKNSLMTYLYTDRPVYRPGHQVHFRGLVRAAASLGYQLPSAGEIAVNIEDPDGKAVLQRTFRLNNNGAFSGDWTVPGTAPLGYYSISARSGEQYVGNAGFNVEEYRKPEYEVRVMSQSARVLQGDTVKASINARYYFGEPVPGGKVTWVAHRSRYWVPYYEEDIEEENASGEGDEYPGNEQVEEKTGQLDAQGNLNIEFPSEKSGHDLRYRIEARVTDQAGREVSGAGYVIATRARFFVHAEPDRYVYEAGDQARLRIETRDYEGKPVGNIPFSVELMTTGKQERVVATASGRTDATGIGSAELRVTGGSLRAKVLAKDNDGRETDDSTWLWVGGGGWDWGSRQRVEIVPDRKSYKEGDVAKILIVTGVPGASVWVTTESQGVIDSRVIEVRGSTATVDVPIRAAYSPNVFVNATFFRDGQMYAGSKSIKVPPVSQKIDVSVKPSKTQFQPGERGIYAIDAKDAAGKPVNADFSLGIVDEAIYAIHREAVPDILTFFYGRRYDAVNTNSSLHYNFSGSSGKRRMQLTQIREGLRAAIKPEKFVDPRVRKAFPDTLYWIADVRTGPSGHVEVPVEFPDALTTWRATARGITPDTHVGSAVDKTIVRKNLILRLTAPRFFMQGDEITVAAIVQNYLPTEKTVRVSLDVRGLELMDGVTRDVKVASRGTEQVFFRLRAGSPGSAVLLGKALTDEESDALELTVPVNPYGTKMSSSKTGLIDTASEANTQVVFPNDANPASRTVEITVSPSVAGTLFSALDYLTTFPYGCTEQTMSSFLPNVVVSQAVQQLGLKSAVDPVDLTRKVRAGLERLYSYQHDDGGWGWWHTDDSSVFMTAYVVAGLAQAQTAGYKLKEEVLGKATNWITTQLPLQKKVSPDLRAYVAYALVLAGAPDAALTNSVWDKRGDLSPYGTALLGLALRTVKDERSEELASSLQRSVRSEDGQAFWEMKSDPMLGVYVDVTSEATAYAVKFLSGQRPNSDLLPKAALYLVTHRDQGYYWSSTKQTAMVIFGLTDYLRVTKELQPDLNASVQINGNPVSTKHFGAGDVAGITLRIPATQAMNAIHIGRSGSGRLYYSARAAWFSTADRLASTGSGTLSVTREYFRLSPEKKGDKIVYRLTSMPDTIEKGDILAVRLRVRGTDWQYLLTEDPIPSGTEFIQRDDLYDLQDKPDWWARWFSRREFHDDRMALFQQWFPSGESEQSYLLKVVNSGKFRIPAARVEPMYQPGIYATSDTRSLEVR